MKRRLEDVVSIEYLVECFKYDEINGKLYWKEDRPLKHFTSDAGYRSWKYLAGKEAGTNAKNHNIVYRIVKVGGVRTTVHKVIYAMVYGVWCECIDHIDGDGLNNLLTNLKPSNKKDNAKNQKKHSRNTSGCSGVSYYKASGKWLASGSKIVEGKRVIVYLGYHDTIFEAACARISWQNQEGYSSRHGR